MKQIARVSNAILIGIGLLLLAELMACIPGLARADDSSDKLVIVKAVYGDLPSGKKADVTAKVAAMAKDNALSVDATNENFDDPAQGEIKALRVDYTVGGAVGAKVVNEHETLTITAGEKPPVIVKALFGDLEHPAGGTADVTEKVIAMVREGEVLIPATAEKFSDPAKSAHKKLRIDYTINGKPFSKTVDENVYLLVAPVVAQSGNLLIRRARYGDMTPSSMAVDVTDLVATSIKNGALSMDVSDARFGTLGDPADSGKKLELVYVLNGAEMQKTFAQDETVTIPSPASTTKR
jgi:hypothetical protein